MLRFALLSALSESAPISRNSLMSSRRYVAFAPKIMRIRAEREGLSLLRNCLNPLIFNPKYFDMVV